MIYDIIVDLAYSKIHQCGKLLKYLILVSMMSLYMTSTPVLQSHHNKYENNQNNTLNVHKFNAVVS